MDALSFLKVKFPMWEVQDRGAFNTVSLREENLIEAMEEFAELKQKDSKDYSCAKQDPTVQIEEFPLQMFSPVGRKSNEGKWLFRFEAEKRFPAGWKVTDFDKDQRLVEVEDNQGERSWLVIPLLFKQINFTKPTRIKQIDETVFEVVFHSIGSYPSKNGEALILVFEKL